MSEPNHAHEGTAHIRYIEHSHDGLDYHTHENDDEAAPEDTGVKEDPNLEPDTPTVSERILTFQMEQEERLALEARRTAAYEQDIQRLAGDLELHKQEVQRNEERYQERVKDAKQEREEWRRHVANVERANELLIEVLKRIALAVEGR